MESGYIVLFVCAVLLLLLYRGTQWLKRFLWNRGVHMMEGMRFECRFDMRSPWLKSLLKR